MDVKSGPRWRPRAWHVLLVVILDPYSITHWAWWRFALSASVVLMIAEAAYFVAGRGLSADPRSVLPFLGKGDSPDTPDVAVWRGVMVATAPIVATWVLVIPLAAADLLLPDYAQGTAAGEVWRNHTAARDALYIAFGWGVFNALPLLPLDGGHAIRAVLTRALGPVAGLWGAVSGSLLVWFIALGLGLAMSSTDLLASAGVVLIVLVGGAVGALERREGWTAAGDPGAWVPPEIASAVGIPVPAPAPAPSRGVPVPAPTPAASRGVPVPAPAPAPSRGVPVPAPAPAPVPRAVVSRAGAPAPSAPVAPPAPVASRGAPDSWVRVPRTFGPMGTPLPPDTALPPPTAPPPPAPVDVDPLVRVEQLVASGHLDEAWVALRGVSATDVPRSAWQSVVRAADRAGRLDLSAEVAEAWFTAANSAEAACWAARSACVRARLVDAFTWLLEAHRAGLDDLTWLDEDPVFKPLHGAVPLSERILAASS